MLHFFLFLQKSGSHYVTQRAARLSSRALGLNFGLSELCVAYSVTKPVLL